MIIAAAVPLAPLVPVASAGTAAGELGSSCGPSIAVSYLLAACATLAALACAARIRAHPRRLSPGLHRAAWTTAAVLAVDVAVWSTQLTGDASCAYGGALSYEAAPLVVGAFVVPLATAVAFLVVAQDPGSSRRLVFGGLVSGAGWATASFLTIGAVQTASGLPSFDGVLATLAVVMNAGSATVLCWAAFHLTGHYHRAIVAAALLGASIRGDFFTLLAGTRLSPSPDHAWTPGLDPFALALVTAAGSTIVLMFIAVAAVGGLLRPDTKGLRLVSPPRPKLARRGPVPVAAVADAAPEPAAAAAPAQGEPAPGPGLPEEVGAGTEHATVPLARTAVPVRSTGLALAPPMAADLTFEEQTYVGLGIVERAEDPVELLPPLDDDTDVVTPGKAAIEDVLTAAEPSRGLGLVLDDEAGAEPVSAPAPAAAPPPSVLPRRGTAAAARLTDPVSPGSGELVALLLPASSLSVHRPDDDHAEDEKKAPAAPPAITAVDTVFAGGARPLTPTSRVWTGALLLGARAALSTDQAVHPASPLPLPLRARALPASHSLTTPVIRPEPAAATGGGDGRHGDTADASSPAGALPSLWFPPPAWWFHEQPTTTARSRRDDPNAPTKPLMLVPARPQR